MSEGQQQPKLFTHKPKKGQRSSGPQMAASAPSSASSSSKASASSGGDGGVKTKIEGLRGVSTSSGASPTPPQPFWYRYRGAIATLLVVNVAVFGYALLNNKKKSEVTEKAEPSDESALQSEDDKEVIASPTGADTKTVLPVIETDAARISPEPSPPKAPVLDSPKISKVQQRELYKWMLTELRKSKPVNPVEKDDIDKKKELLKQFIRSKEMPSI